MEQHGKVIARSGRKAAAAAAAGASHASVLGLSPTAAAHATVDHFSSGNAAPSMQLPRQNKVPEGNGLATQQQQQQQQLQLERRRVASLEFAEEDEDDRQVIGEVVLGSEEKRGRVAIHEVQEKR
jgi:hypothetical protein